MVNQTFKILDCALIAIATGEKAQNLRELRDILKNIHHGCLYYHFWGGLLRPHFDDPEFQNDFAVWASRNLHDSKISEQLSIINPNVFKDMEDLRREVIEIIEERLSESEHVPWVKTGQEFYFVRSQIVIFDTGITYNDPKDLLEIIPNMSLGSIFFHFIDARRRTPDKRNDFSVWLTGFGDKYDGLIEGLDNIDPYFTTLNELRQEINFVFHNYFKGGV
ncbi:MAG: DUF5752 family protein [Desulfobacterales bacterium]|nr:DUF5752 family protein [Desulfobacterales bacterium]